MDIYLVSLLPPSLQKSPIKTEAWQAKTSDTMVLALVPRALFMVPRSLWSFSAVKEKNKTKNC